MNAHNDSSTTRRDHGDSLSVADDGFPRRAESRYPPPFPPVIKKNSDPEPVITVTTPTRPPTLDRPAAHALLALLIHLATDTEDIDTHAPKERT